MVLVGVYNISLLGRIVELLQSRVMPERQARVHNYILFVPKEAVRESYSLRHIEEKGD